MDKRIAHIHKEQCKGCLLCTTVCPTHALQQSNEINKKGYQIVIVNEELCIGCGNCYRICPDYVYEIK